MDGLLPLLDEVDPLPEPWHDLMVGLASLPVQRLPAGPWLHLVHTELLSTKLGVTRILLCNRWWGHKRRAAPVSRPWPAARKALTAEEVAGRVGIGQGVPW